ncbi:hypothetical protein LTR86_010399 [Recurvomyces mirabilis]|nr:hypothetical protein LTR86_010399 [Recurvomyces mirabilis]
MVRIFKSRCKREEEDNFVKAVLDEPDVSRARQSAAIVTSIPTASHIRQLPILQGYRLKCLNGWARVLAAKQHLDRNDQWWVARIYAWVQVSPAEQLLAAEEYRNEQPHSDGEIFRKVCLYRRDGLCDDERRWWERLSLSKAKDLRQLLAVEAYAKAFEKLLEWPGLWDPVHLGSLHRLLPMRCTEEALAYLEYISEALTTITCPALEDLLPAAVDAITVHHLQGLSPSKSRADAETVTSLMQRRVIFPTVSDVRTRDRLLRSILDYPDMIPSLFTFFESLKYLEPGAQVLKSLLPPKQKKTIREAFFATYTRPAQLLVQHDVDDQRLGQLVWTVGFELEAADRLRSDEAAVQSAQSLLSTWGLELTDPTTLKRLGDILRDARVQSSSESVSAASVAKSIALERRVGRPFEDDYDRDRAQLFLPQMYNANLTDSGVITSLYCVRAMFRRCFKIRETMITAQIGEQIPLSATMTSVPETSCEHYAEVQHGQSCRAGVVAGSAIQQTLVADLQQKLKDSDAEVVHLEAAQSVLRAELTLARTDAQKLSQAQASSRETIDTMNIRMNDLKQERNHLVGECAELRSSAVAREEELREHRTRMDTVEQQSQAALQQLAQESQMHTELVQTVSALKRRLREEESMVERLTGECAQATSELAASLAMNHELTAEVGRQRAEVDNLQARLEVDVESGQYALQVQKQNADEAFRSAKVDYSHETEQLIQALKEKEDCLGALLAQMDQDQQSHELLPSTAEKNDILIIIVACIDESEQVQSGYATLTIIEASELIKQYASVLSRYELFLGLDRERLQIIPEGRSTISENIFKAWREREVLWVIPAASAVVLSDTDAKLPVLAALKAKGVSFGRPDIGHSTRLPPRSPRAPIGSGRLPTNDRSSGAVQKYTPKKRKRPSERSTTTRAVWGCLSPLRANDGPGEMADVLPTLCVDQGPIVIDDLDVQTVPNDDCLLDAEEPL